MLREFQSLVCVVMVLLSGCNSTPTVMDQQLMLKVLASEGDAQAQCILGSAYRQGLSGFNQDDSVAFKWFEKSANQGYLDAMELLSICYLQGRGVTQDLVNAYFWAELAIHSGSVAAIEIRKALIENMSDAQIAEAQKLALAKIKSR